MRNTLLYTAIATALASPAALADTDADAEDRPRHHSEIERIVVRALPLDHSQLETAQPVDIIAGEELDDKRGATLGETLQAQPGIHSSYFGPGAGRPVIRGHAGHRVRILEDGLGVADASAQSDDHAVSAEPLLIDQIEILRGPSTLLYGSGAIGGVVNVIDNAIPETVPEKPIEGGFEARGNTAADERAGVVRLDGGGGNIAWHLSGAWRDAGDYDIPGAAEVEDEHDHGDHDHDHDHEEHEGGEAADGTLENSFAETKSGTAGLSWIGSRGFLGASFRGFETEYGIPVPHAHEDDHHGDDHEHDHHHGDEEEAHHDIVIDMKQRTTDVKGGLLSPLPGFERATLRLRYNDYEHAELDDGEPETVFKNEAFQGRLELVQSPVSGWESAVGLQYDDEDFSAEGEEAFIPDGNARSVALFLLQERHFGNFAVNVGGRVERTRIKVDDGHGHHEEEAHDHEHDHEHEHEHEDGHEVDQRSFTSWSAALGGIYHFSEDWSASLNLSRAQRAPNQGELFADGPHLATFSFERGNPHLNKETTTGVDLGLHAGIGPFDLHVDLFYNSVDDYIFLHDTGETDHGLPVRDFEQGDARFHGMEIEGVFELHDTAVGDFDLRTFYDRVRGKLKGGDNLPRISPDRLGAGVDWYFGKLRAGFEGYRVFGQERISEFETETGAYTMLNARIAYGVDLGAMELELFLRGNNLADKEARVHTSHIKNFAPLPGRNFTFGVRGFF